MLHKCLLTPVDNCVEVCEELLILGNLTQSLHRTKLIEASIQLVHDNYWHKASTNVQYDRHLNMWCSHLQLVAVADSPHAYCAGICVN